MARTSLAKLALPVVDETLLGFDRALLPIAGRAGLAAYRNLGETLLLYRLVPETMVMFIGHARLMSVQVAGKSERACRLEQLQRFEAEPVSEAEARVPGVRWMLQPDTARFDAIVAEAKAGETIRMGADEAGSAFRLDARTLLQAYEAVYDEVLRNWDYCCAFTGERFARTGRPHPMLHVVAIYPREAGGQVHVRNYLPMTAAAKLAWTAGHLTLGPDLSFVVNKRRIDPEFEERLRPIGALLPPVDGGQAPDEANVAYHRTHVFGR